MNCSFGFLLHDYQVSQPGSCFGSDSMPGVLLKTISPLMNKQNTASSQAVLLRGRAVWKLASFFKLEVVGSNPTRAIAAKTNRSWSVGGACQS